MISDTFFSSQPKRVLWIGAAILGIGAVLGGVILAMLSAAPIYEIPPRLKKGQAAKEESLDFSLGLRERAPSFPLPDLQKELFFSFTSPRPGKETVSPSLFARLKKSGQSKCITLPHRLDLQCVEGGVVTFAEGESDFWVEVVADQEKGVEVRPFIVPYEGEKVEGGRWIAIPEKSPIQVVQELEEGTPFRVLGEAKWRGTNLFQEKYGKGKLLQQLEIGPHLDFLELTEGEWLVWKEGKWKKESSFPTEGLIARIEAIQGRGLILEGWDGEKHIRLSFPLSPSLSFKGRAEELFGSIRVRSDKQISCTLEKQCLILRVGDWAVKREGRWKVLRRKEEREAFQSGKIVGELFAFEKIEIKQGQKYVQGSLFDATRSQCLSFDLPAQSHRKSR